jgi:hypothetical protein
MRFGEGGGGGEGEGRGGRRELNGDKKRLK